MRCVRPNTVISAAEAAIVATEANSSVGRCSVMASRGFDPRFCVAVPGHAPFRCR